MFSSPLAAAYPRKAPAGQHHRERRTRRRLHQESIRPTSNESGGTDIVHGENFKGLLVWIIKPEQLKVEFERMNGDMAAEVARRHPASPASAAAQ
jgi:hypothetical protein